MGKVLVIPRCMTSLQPMRLALRWIYHSLPPNPKRAPWIVTQFSTTPSRIHPLNTTMDTRRCLHRPKANSLQQGLIRRLGKRPSSYITRWSSAHLDMWTLMLTWGTSHPLLKTRYNIPWILISNTREPSPACRRAIVPLHPIRFPVNQFGHSCISSSLRRSLHISCHHLCKPSSRGYLSHSDTLQTTITRFKSSLFLLIFDPAVYMILHRTLQY